MFCFNGESKNQSSSASSSARPTWKLSVHPINRFLHKLARILERFSLDTLRAILGIGGFSTSYYYSSKSTTHNMLPSQTDVRSIMLSVFPP